ncbi:MAG: preprotein translocase subunit SecE [Candidatus Edwardsbacteria bacterium]
MKRIINFFKEVHLEFTKVSWPRRDELFQSTIVVIVLSLLVALFIGIVDITLSKLITAIFG